MSDPGVGTDAVVTTARLVLRRLTHHDLDALAAIQRDPETMLFLGGPRSRALTRERLGWIIEAERRHGYGLWAPENTASRAVARRIGMHHERDLTFEGRPTSLFALPPAPR